MCVKRCDDACGGAGAGVRAVCVCAAVCGGAPAARHKEEIRERRRSSDWLLKVLMMRSANAFVFEMRKTQIAILTVTLSDSRRITFEPISLIPCFSRRCRRPRPDRCFEDTFALHKRKNIRKTVPQESRQGF